MNRAIPIGILTILAIAGACGGSGDHPPTAIHARVSPRQPLRHAACMSEMRAWGYSVGAARQFGCSESASRAPWFHATFRNASAHGTYIQCTFTAWDAGGRQVFRGWLPLAVVSMPAGVYLNPHQSRSIDWYFDARTYPAAVGHAGAVARYTTFCTPWENPPI